jgi:hypothetical protein
MGAWSNGRRKNSSGRGRARRLPQRPAAEWLEDRRLMTVFNVNSTADILNPGPGVVTLRSAIQAANASPGNNTINLTVPGTYAITTPGLQTDNTAGEFAITGTGNLNIVNTSGGPAIVDGGGLNRVFDINPAGVTTPFTVTFQGLTITGGSATSAANADGPDASGGGIRAQGGASVVLNDDVLTGNTATADGGAIALESPKNDSTGTLTINGSTISDNHAGDAGGGVETDGTGTVTINPGTVITGNTCVNQGAGIWLDAGGAALDVTGAIISDNTAITMLAGGIGNAGAGNVTISDSLIEGNFSGGTGGGFGDAANMGNLTVSDSFFINNVAANNGGGIQEGGPDTTISDSYFDNNLSQGNGGGLFVDGANVKVSDTRFSGNVAVNGAAVEDNAATFTMTGSTLDHNHTRATADGSGGNGGGLDVATGATSVTVANSLFLNNTASNAGAALGGGINQVVGSLIVRNSQFTGNAADLGGAVNFAGTTLTASGTTFDHNRSIKGGGALAFAGTGTVAGGNGSTLTNDTFFANTTAGNGGAILDAGPGDLSLTNDTINGNAAGGNGGGIALTATGQLALRNTIIAQDTAGGTGPDVFTGTGLAVTDQGGNLLGTLAGATGFGPATLTGNPVLGPLLDNGGQFAGAPDDSQVVQTEALLPGSPAFDKGVTSGAPTVDERGFPRPGFGNANLSIGAYEPQYGPNATPAQIFVENLFEVLLNRPAGNGASPFVNLLNRGASTASVARLIVGSSEYRNDEVQSIYQQYLHRAADPAGLQYFSGLLASGVTVEQVEAYVTGSDEYYQQYGGVAAVYLEGLYEDALGRSIDPGSRSYLGQQIDGGMSRNSLGKMVFSSTEYLGDLVQSDFEAYLGRQADPSATGFFVGLLQSQATDEVLVVDILSSDEAILKRT